MENIVKHNCNLNWALTPQASTRCNFVSRSPARHSLNIETDTFSNMQMPLCMFYWPFCIICKWVDQLPLVAFQSIFACCIADKQQCYSIWSSTRIIYTVLVYYTDFCILTFDQHIGVGVSCWLPNGEGWICECDQSLHRHGTSIHTRRVEDFIYVRIYSTYDTSYEFHPTWQMYFGFLRFVHAFDFSICIELPSTLRDVFRNSVTCACVQPPNWHGPSIQHVRRLYNFISLVNAFKRWIGVGLPSNMKINWGIRWFAHTFNLWVSIGFPNETRHVFRMSCVRLLNRRRTSIPNETYAL
jgi:hypothetical protein